MKTILFIGGTGFIGSKIIDYFSHRDFRIIVLSRKGKSASKKFYNYQNIKFIQASLAEIEIIEDTIVSEHVDIVIHLASNLIPSSTKEDFESELKDIVYPTMDLMNLISMLEKQVIFFSSGGMVYGKTNQMINESSDLQSINYYGKAKLMIEKNIISLNKKSSLNFIILRPSNVYGKIEKISSEQGFIEASMIRMLESKPIVVWGTGEQTRDYLHISDMVDVVYKIIDKNLNNKIFNIASGESHSLLEVINILENVLQIQASVDFKAKRSIDVDKLQFDINYLKSFIDFYPINLCKLKHFILIH